MDLHKRVMQVLEGRAKMGAGKKKAPARKKVVKKKKKAPVKKGGVTAGIRAGMKNKKRVSSAKRAVKKNPWVQYVKDYARMNNITYGEALKLAGPSYHAQGC